ncbi:MAG TPA: methyltransferase domain-containing protein [Longimicrobiales bacterium]|nr:methyltransferase domain-containing protein [Longimicrobiales bacterium]
MLKRSLLAAALAAAASPAALSAQVDAADAAWLVEALDIGPGSSVAEIGAGNGQLSIALAQEVGTGGRVFATELGDRALDRLTRQITMTGLPNVTIVSAHPERTNLPPACCDAIFMRFVYQHFTNAEAMNASLLESLRPGGRLGVIELTPPEEESADSVPQIGVSPDTLRAQLTEAGFEVVSVEERPGRLVYLVARKP